MNDGVGAMNEARFDSDVFDGLAGVVGPSVLDSIVAKFQVELAARFSRPDVGSDTDRLAKDAHAMISSAGMLGFVGLIPILRRLEAGKGSLADLDDCLAELAAELRRVAADLDRQKTKLRSSAA